MINSEQDDPLRVPFRAQEAENDLKASENNIIKKTLQIDKEEVAKTQKRLIRPVVSSFIVAIFNDTH